MPRAAARHDPVATRFVEPGSLQPPGPLGRLIRLGFGVMLLTGLVSLVGGAAALFSMRRPPTDLSFWILVAIALHITPYVVNIGFGVAWRRRSQVAVIAIAGGLVVVDLLSFGTWWAPPLGVFVWVWLVWFCAHLGSSFVLAALLATPGCEMRALPHLWTMVTGRPSREHYCPGPLDRIDRWEARRETP